ncbi:MAG: VOC family protein [Limnochordales bacterium]|nr:glyoxalase [Bacillota bacterium]
MSIHPATYMGPVHYTVNDLDRQVAFYRDILGFRVLRQEGRTAVLGAPDRELVRLTEVPGAPRPRGTTGLYHTAFLLPTRWDLAHLIYRIAATRTPIHGHSNHGTHLAFYLPDAEGNGIELAWDFPKEQWPMRNGRMRFEDLPREGIDIPELMKELERDPRPWPGLPAGTVVGHVHLHVSDLDTARRFYHELLGFDVTMDDRRFGAVFVSAGGYHHHIGMNIWKGVGAPPPPEGAAGLRWFTVVLPSAEELARLLDRLRAAGVEPLEDGDGGVLVYDPSRNGVRLVVGQDGRASDAGM